MHENQVREIDPATSGRDQLQKLRRKRLLIGAGIAVASVLAVAIAIKMPMGLHHSGLPKDDGTAPTSTSTLSEMTGIPTMEFFTDKGEVDTKYVSDFVDTLPPHPPGFEDRISQRLKGLIDADAAKGSITQQQADALKEAFYKKLGL
jgi:hypothetical protein